MSEAVVSSLITGGLSLFGVVITCLLTARKSENAMRVNQAVTDTKLDELTTIAKKHGVKLIVDAAQGVVAVWNGMTSADGAMRLQSPARTPKILPAAKEASLPRTMTNLRERLS